MVYGKKCEYDNGDGYGYQKPLDNCFVGMWRSLMSSSVDDISGDGEEGISPSKCHYPK